MGSARGSRKPRNRVAVEKDAGRCLDVAAGAGGQSIAAAHRASKGQEPIRPRELLSAEYHVREGLARRDQGDLEGAIAEGIRSAGEVV